jgi:hypothetical protein
MAHEVFVGIAQEVIAISAIAVKIQLRLVEDPHQIGEPVHHFLAAAQFRRVVEVRLVYDAFQAVGVGQLVLDTRDPYLKSTNAPKS